MGWLSELLRGEPEPPAPAAPEEAVIRDDLPFLKGAVADLVREINASAGRLPAVAVVSSRRITDTLASVLELGAEQSLSVETKMAIRGIVTDYLPTTLRTYVKAERAGEASAADELRKQVDELSRAARRLLEAVQRHDKDAQRVQGMFLESKYQGEGERW